MFYLVWDVGDPESETSPQKITRAAYATQAEAKAQAEVDLERNVNVLGVTNKDGKFVWTPGEEDGVLGKKLTLDDVGAGRVRLKVRD